MYQKLHFQDLERNVGPEHTTLAIRSNFVWWVQMVALNLGFVTY
jgi:hypothetical protein